MSGNSESMIEKVAEALCAQWSIAHKLPIAGDVRQFYIDSAHAAIEAMREPTKEMLYFGEGYSDMIQPEAVGPNSPESRQEELRSSWHIMIDNARGVFPPPRRSAALSPSREDEEK